VWNLLAFLLILSPVDLPVPRTAPEPLFVALQRVAQLLDLTDDRDRWRDDFAAEVRWCRQTWRELRYCPPSSTIVLLPPHDICFASLDANRSFQEYLRLRGLVLLHRQFELERARAECRLPARIWHAAAEATSPGTLVHARRRALCRLRELIGDDYQMPPPVPSRLLRVVD
jgi:hypothetical protein